MSRSHTSPYISAYSLLFMNSSLSSTPSKPVIRIGFPFASHPRIFKNHLGKWTGIHVDVWQLYAESIGAVVEFAYPDFQHFGPDDPEVDGKFVSGVLGLMQNDSIDAAMGDYTLQQGRMGNFRYTPQYDYQPVSEMYDFRFETTGMRAWRHREIGEGLFFPYKSFVDDGNGGALWIMSKGGYFPVDGEQDNFWRKSAKKDDRQSDDDGLFSCPELTCSESFESMEDLEAHVIEGNHTASPLKMSMRDRSLHMFKDQLEGVAQSRLQIPEVDDVVRELELSDDDGLPKVEKGYALKKKKTSVRYKESAKEFICQLFDEGIRTGTKISPEVAEQRMFSERNADGSKRFSAEERLNSRQISSFYSRITSDRKENQGASTVCVSSVPSTTPSPNGGATTVKGKGRKCKGKGGRGKRQIEFTEEDEIEDIDEMLVFSDAGYLSDGDMIAMAVNESLHEFFDLDAPFEIFEKEVQKNARWTAPNFAFFDPSIHGESEFFDPPEIEEDCKMEEDDYHSSKEELF